MSQTGLKQVWNKSEAALQQPWNRLETGLKQVRNRSETGLKQVWNTPERSLKQDWNKSETGVKQVWNKNKRCETRLKQVFALAESLKEKYLGGKDFVAYVAEAFCWWLVARPCWACKVYFVGLLGVYSWC